MTTARIDFGALPANARLEPVVLIAGLPVVFTAAGVRPTTTAVSSGTVDALWWPGTGTLTQTFPDGSTWDPVRDLLDPNAEWLTRQALDMVKGDVRVEPLPVDLFDRDGAATAILSRRSAASAQLLASDLTAGGTVVTLGASTGFSSSGGIAHVGREAIGYSGQSGASLTGLTRGLFGSAAVSHRVGYNRGASDPVVISGALPRYVQGRRATVWLCRVSADGTTLTDPTLWFQGIVGAGVVLVSGGARWQITLDPITEIFARAPEVPVMLEGWQFGNTRRGDLNPLSTIPDVPTVPPTTNGGVAPNFAEFQHLWATTPSGAVWQLAPSNGNLAVTYTGSPTGTNDPYIRSYLDPMEILVPPGQTRRFQGCPDTLLVLDGMIALSDTDFARIPSTLSFNAPSPRNGVAFYALIADTASTEHAAAVIFERTAGTPGVTPGKVTLEARTALRGLPRVKAFRIFERTQAHVGIVSDGEPVGALYALSLALAQLGGADDFSSAVDWDHLESVFRGVPTSAIPARRAYEVGASDDTLLTILADEARLRGCTLTLRRGRITAIRLASFARSEAVGATAITRHDLLVDGSPPKPIPFEVIDQPEPPACSVEFKLKNGDALRFTDDSFAAEFGDTKIVESGVLRWVPNLTETAAELASTLAVPAQQILGVLAEPQRVIRLPLGPPFAGLEPGDLIVLTHDEVPNWDGTRGVTDQVCQVEEVERTVFGGRCRAMVSVRLGETGIGGYAPEALIAAGGLSSGSTVVTLDTTSAFGASCFAPPGESPTYGFEIGDVVLLSQYDVESVTVAELTRTITDIDRTAHTITLSSAPGAPMAAQAASAYGVVIRTASWTDATSAAVGEIPAQQSRFSFVADDATGAFSDGSLAKRWAA